MSGAFEAKSGKLKSGFSSGKSGDIYIITSEGKVVLLVHPNSTNPLEDIRRNIKAVHQDEFDKKIKALESKPSGGGGGGLTEEQVLALIKRALKGRTGLFPIATPPNVFRPGMIIKGSDINGSQWSFPVQYLNRGITG
ncbi:hypothetical protein, partial [Candidatus Liberibacter sp.]|uniref:hypothetical protein n=1 Tax=Candidatus Liberibacter sp. TaxID=34022 RepID=UPI001C711584